MFLQWRSGAYTADLASNEDEAAHAVSSLLVHDYLARPFRPTAKPMPAHPMRFAETYYAHYPKLAIGHWPPFFYATEAVWMMAAGRAKAPMLALLAIFAFAFAAAVFLFGRRVAGDPAALAAAVFVLTLPVVRESFCSVRPEIVIGLSAFIAAAAYARLLETRRAGLAVFCVTIVIALLAHQRSAPVLLIPVAGAVLTGRAEILRRRAFWISAALALGLSVPWFLVTERMRQTLSVGAAGVFSRTFQFPLVAAHVFGWIPLAFAAAGALRGRHRQEPAVAAMTALIAAVWIFHAGANEPIYDRFLVIVAGPAAVLMAYTWRRISPKPAAVAALAGGVLAVHLWSATPFPRKERLGYPELVESLLAGPDRNRRVYLIAGDALHEGSFIAEVLLRERPGGHIIVRASKALASTVWGTQYELLVHSPREAAEYLSASHVGVVVMQDTRSPAHMDFLQSALAGNPAWQPVAAPPGIRMYRRIEPEPAGPLRLRINMRGSLNRDIELIE